MFRMIDLLFKVTLTEWKAFAKDPAVMLIVFFGVVFYAFYYPYPYKNQVANKAPAAIVDLDHSAMSHQIIRAASAMQEDTIVAVYENELEAQQALADEKIYGYMKIPQGLEADLRKGQNASVGIYCHGGFILLYGNVATAFTTAAMSVGATTQVKRIVMQGHSLSEAMAIRDPIPTRFFRMFNASGGYGIYAVSAVLMIILQQTLLVAVGVMGGPRKNRHFKVFKDNDETEGAPLLIRYFGRSLAYILHYLVALFFFKFVIYHVFGFPDRGNIGLVLLFGLLFFGAVVNMGMWIAQFFRHRETALLVFASVPIFVVFASGFSWPSGNMLCAIQMIAAFIPSTYAIPAWLSIQNIGANFQEVSHNLIRLFELSVFYLFLGLIHAKREDLLGRVIWRAKKLRHRWRRREL